MSHPNIEAAWRWSRMLWPAAFSRWVPPRLQVSVPPCFHFCEFFHFLSRDFAESQTIHNMNNAFMLPLIQSVPVLSQHPVNNSKTLQPFILFTPFAPTYCRWDATLLPQRFMGRAVIWTPLWKIGLKSVRSNFGLWHQGLLLSQVVMHPCPPDKQWKASLQTLQFAYFHFDCRPTEQITKEGKRVRTIVKQSNWQSITCG